MIFSLVEHPDSTPHRSFWQSEIWKEILTDSGQADEVFYFGNLIHAVLVEVRSIWLGQRGAFILWVYSRDVPPGLIVSLGHYLRKKSVLFLHIEPLDTKISGTESWYRSFLVPHTRIIHLEKSLDDILREMHEKWRYNIRLAEKRGIRVEKVPPTEANISRVMELIKETTDRDGFASNSRAYYQSFLSALEKAGIGWLYFAYYDDRVIALTIWVFTEERAIYYYGASTSDKEMRKHMAPYLLQWRMIQDAKNAGSKIYDFLGVADPDNPKDPLAGVSSFKEKFGGEVVRLPQKTIISLSWKSVVFRWVYVLKKLLKR